MRVRAPAVHDLALSAVVAATILGPLLLSGGYWLVGDMVFVPQQPWKPAWLGLDGALPRAVPMDAVVSVLTQVVPGWVLQRVFLVGAFLVGGLGAGRLVAAHGGWARTAAILVMLWNPWVHDRLMMGQWAILAGYLLLPWVALAALGLRDDVRRHAAPLAVALVLSAVCSPSSGLMAVLVAAVLGLRRTRVHVLAVALPAVIANLPWLVPTLVASSGSVTVRGAFDAFAPRGETGLGALTSLLSLGGTWKSAIVAPERTSVLVVLTAGLLTVAALIGLRASRLRGGGALRRLTVLAAVSVVLAALPVLPGGIALLEAVGDVVPGVAILRDSQRFLAPAVLLLVVGVAGLVEWLRARARTPGREAVWIALVATVLAPVCLLPSLAWGDLGRLPVSDYPAEWDEVADVLRERGTARTIVLPWRGSYRGYEWNGRRAVLDPAPRFFPGEVLIDDRTFVDSSIIGSEDPRVAEVTSALDSDDPAKALVEAGVRWVLVEHGMPAGAVPEGTVVHEGEHLTLIDLGGAEPKSSDRPEGAWLVVLGDALAALLLFCAIAHILRTRGEGSHAGSRRHTGSLGGTRE